MAAERAESNGIIGSGQVKDFIAFLNMMFDAQQHRGCVETKLASCAFRKGIEEDFLVLRRSQLAKITRIGQTSTYLLTLSRR